MHMRRSRMDVRGSRVHVWSRGVHVRVRVCWLLLGSFEDSRTLEWDTRGVSDGLNVGIDRDNTRGTSTLENITEASSTKSILWMVFFATYNGVSVMAGMRVAVAFRLLDEGLAQIREATALHDFFASDVVYVDLIVVVVVGVVVIRSLQLVAIVVIVLLRIVVKRYVSLASALSGAVSMRLLGLLSRVRAFIIRAIDVGVVAVSLTAMVAVAVRSMIVGVMMMIVRHMVSVGVMAVAWRRSRMAVAVRRSRMAVAVRIVTWHTVSVSRATVWIMARVTMGSMSVRAMTMIVGMRSVTWRR